DVIVYPAAPRAYQRVARREFDRRAEHYRQMDSARTVGVHHDGAVFVGHNFPLNGVGQRGNVRIRGSKADTVQGLERLSAQLQDPYRKWSDRGGYAIGFPLSSAGRADE